MKIHKISNIWTYSKTLANVTEIFRNIYHVIYILPSGVERFSHLPYFTQIAPGNVLCHYNKHLMEYLELPHGSRIICLPLNISENYTEIALHWKPWKPLSKPRRGRDSSPSSLLIRYNILQYQPTLKNNIYHLNKRGPPAFFYSDTNPVLGHVLVHSVDKTHVLVVTVELIWLLFLNILSFNFVPTPKKSLRFTRFRRSPI